MNANTHTNTPWEILGVPENATKDEIRAAHHTLAKFWHPDRNRAPNAQEMMKSLNWALEMVLDPSKYKSEKAKEERNRTAEQEREEKYEEERRYRANARAELEAQAEARARARRAAAEEADYEYAWDDPTSNTANTKARDFATWINSNNMHASEHSSYATFDRYREYPLLDPANILGHLMYSIAAGWAANLIFYHQKEFVVIWKFIVN